MQSGTNEIRNIPCQPVPLGRSLNRIAASSAGVLFGMKKEIWKSIPSTSFYEVSNFGRARALSRTVGTYHGTRTKKSKDVALTDNGHGYKIFGTCINDRKKNYYIHRMVATLFIPNPLNLPEVNHKDGDKSNNHVDNLEWTDRQGNQDHASANDLIAFGERSSFAKLTEKKVLEILQRCAAGENIPAMAGEYGVRDTCIYRIRNGKRWRRVTQQFKGEQH